MRAMISTMADSFSTPKLTQSKTPADGNGQKQDRDCVAQAQDDGPKFTDGIGDDGAVATQKSHTQAQDAGSDSAAVPFGGTLNVGAPGWEETKGVSISGFPEPKPSTPGKTTTYSDIPEIFG
jgi:hypothetical protein